jgi:sugar/nucleoside kinase (ribokinase family)
MDKNTISRLLAQVPQDKIGVAGDFCIDAYWEIRPELGEESIETGLKTVPVVNARYSPGGAGNIISNLRGIGLNRIPCFGVCGSDPFGLWMRRELIGKLPEYDEELVEVNRKDYHTPVYCKPLADGVEQSRIDLGNTPISDEEADKVLAGLEKFMPQLKVLIINEQLANGLHNARFRSGFAELVKRFSNRMHLVFDGRDYLDAYPGVTLKINASAASQQAFGRTDAPPVESGEELLKRSGHELVITDGKNGCYVFEHGKTTYIPAISWDGPVDTVGAGDSFTAGFSYALAVGESLVTAADFGNCCSGITIRKLNQTGAPSPEELFSIVKS